MIGTLREQKGAYPTLRRSADISLWRKGSVQLTGSWGDYTSGGEGQGGRRPGGRAKSGSYNSQIRGSISRM